ncbi:MAG: HYR domain-containing protein [Endomicrobiales bacterium]
MAEANGIGSIVLIGTATATDIFGTTVSNNAPEAYSLGTTTVTWTAIDCNGNVINKTQKVTVIDTTRPILSVPADVTAEATALETPVVIGMATATDIFPVDINNDAPEAYHLGCTTVTWTANDGNGNTSVLSQRVTVIDTTPPQLTIPQDMQVEATGIETPLLIGTATASDIFDVTITSDAPSAYLLGTTTVTWSAVDANGNEMVKTQRVTVVDTTPPVLSVPADVIAEAIALETPVTLSAATATDIYPVDLSNDAPTVYQLGVTTVTWTATDANGNTSSRIQRVTIADTTPPALTLPDDVTSEATGLETAVTIGSAAATDIFPITITNNAPLSYQLGTTTVTWTAIDSSGNKVEGTQRIALVDTTPPVLTVPADVIVEATGSETQVSIGTATAYDIFPVTITSDSPSAFGLGVTTVTWTATDTSGNVSQGGQRVTVGDMTPPVLHVPADLTVEATGLETPVLIGTATANDSSAVTITNDAPETYLLGITTVTWTAADAWGNTTNGIQRIEIVDTTPPELQLPSDVTAEATGPETMVNIGTATVADIYPVTVSNNAPQAFQFGVTTVTWTATDANGNSVQGFQRITIVDTSAPEVTVHISTPVYQSAGNFYISSNTLIELSAQDNGSGIERIEYRVNGETYTYENPVKFDDEGTYFIECVAIDKALNTGPVKSFIAYVDLTHPRSACEVSQEGYQICIDSVTYVNSHAAFAVTAMDPVSGGLASGVRDIGFGVDGSDFTMVPGTSALLNLSALPDGLHSVKYYSSDNVHNAEPVRIYTAVFDGSKPKIVNTFPENLMRVRAKDIECIKITFDEPVSAVSWGESVIVLENKERNIKDYSIAFDTSANALRISGAFKNNTVYTVTVTSTVYDRVHNYLEGYTFKFETYIHAREGGIVNKDKCPELTLIIPPDCLPYDGYIDVDRIDNVQLPQLANPLQWMLGDGTAYEIIYKDTTENVVAELVSQPFQVVLSQQEEPVSFAPALGGLSKVTNLKLYQIGSLGDAAKKAKGKSTALGTKNIASAPVQMSARNGVSKKKQFTAEVSSFGLFSVAGFAAPAVSLEDLSCYPNPFDPLTRDLAIQYYLVRDNNVGVAVYDLLGNLVKTWEISAGDTNAQAGLNQIAWDGRNGQGDVVANGGYIVFVHAAGQHKRFKVLVVK